MSSMTLLGTGTCQIESARRASSILLTLDDTYVLFDCGHGVVQRLLEVGVQHNQLEHVVLSHFHPDHVSDLVPLLQAGAWSQQNPRTTDIHIYGPSGVKSFIRGLLTVFGESSLRQPGYHIEVHEITQGQFAIGQYSFDFISLPPAGNHGLRFTYNGKQYAATGDSHFHQEEIAFLRDVHLAIIDSGHSTDSEIVTLAAASQAQTIVCSHLYRMIDARSLQEQATNRGYTGTIIVGYDLLSFLLP